MEKVLDLHDEISYSVIVSLTTKVCGGGVKIQHLKDDVPFYSSYKGWPMQVQLMLNKP